MRTLHVVVHPEATHHVERKVGGWYDSELTPGGLRTAEHIARSLRSKITPGAELISSDLRRTMQTAQVIGQTLGLEPMPDPRLREKSYGVAGGQPQLWLDTRFVPPPEHGERIEHDEGIPEAETKGDLVRRIYAAMDELLARPAAHQIVVTHGMAVTFVVAAWIGMPPDSVGRVAFKAPSGSITTLHEDDFFHNRSVVALGSLSY